jgi:hypothetical protein
VLAGICRKTKSIGNSLTARFREKLLSVLGAWIDPFTEFQLADDADPGIAIAIFVDCL